MLAIWHVLFVTLIGYVTNGQQLPNFDITDNEISSLINQMRDADVNKAQRGQIQLDYQGHTGSADSDDRAKNS
jgi:hypothetical protein